MITPQSSCLKKKFYDHEWEAVNQAAIQRGYSGHSNIEAYKCVFCAGYHIGHSNRKPKHA